MTLDPRPADPSAAAPAVPSGGPPTVLQDVRQRARRQATSLSGGVMAVLGALLALGAVVAFVVLDYRFQVEPKLIVKLLVGISGLTFVLMKPRVGLFLLPLVTPFLPWIPASPLPGVNALNILSFGVFTTWALGRMLSRQSLLRGGKLGQAMGLLLALGLVSVARGAAIPTGYAYDGWAGLLDLFRSAMVFSGYFICLAMASGPEDRKRMSWAIVLGLLAEALVAIALGRNGRGGRAIGSLGQSNELAAYLVAYTVFATALIPATKAWFGKVVLIGTVAAATFATSITLSRGSYIALALGLLWVALRTSRTWLAIAVFAAITSPIWTPDFVKERMAETQVQVEGSDEVQLEGSAEARLQTWSTIMRVVSEHPLDGVGWSGLGYVLPALGEEMGLDEVKDSAHNTFFRMLGDMGVLGLALFCLLLWRCWSLARAAAKAAQTRFDRQMSVGLEAAVITVVLSCWFGDRFFNILILGSFWILCSLADDLVQERERERAAA